MRQSRNLKVTLLAVAISLIASACAIGGGQATGGQEVIVASESGVENDEDNSLSLGFRPRVQAGEAELTTTTPSDTTNPSQSTTALNSTTSRSSTTQQTPAAPTPTRPPASANPTTTPTTAITTTTVDDPTVGRNDQPIFTKASTALVVNNIVTRGEVHCHESWGTLEIRSTVFEVQGSRRVNVAENSKRIPCKDGLSQIKNDNVNNIHGFDTRVIIEDLPNRKDGELVTYQVQMEASVPSRSNLSTKTRISDPFVLLSFNIQQPNVAPGGWEYFGSTQ